MAHQFHTSPEIIKEWTQAETFNELHITPPAQLVRRVNIGFNPVEQMAYGGVSFFEKTTPFAVALLEKINADLAISMDLPVAPCVMGVSKPQPTLISLGLFSETMSVVQGAYKELNLHGGDEEKLYDFARDRKMVFDIMRTEVKDDLHEKLKPYRSLLSEMLPFLLWARIHDPNLSNIIDRADLIEAPTADPQEHDNAYFIDLEGDAAILSNEFYPTAEWDNKTITSGDLDLILKDWLAENLQVEETFDAKQVWNTVKKIEEMSDVDIRNEIDKAEVVTHRYGFLDKGQQEDILKGLLNIQEMLIARRGQLGQVLFLLEKWWREAGFWFGDVCAVCLAKSVFRC